MECCFFANHRKLIVKLTAANISSNAVLVCHSVSSELQQDQDFLGTPILLPLLFLTPDLLPLPLHSSHLPLPLPLLIQPLRQPLRLLRGPLLKDRENTASLPDSWIHRRAEKEKREKRKRKRRERREKGEGSSLLERLILALLVLLVEKEGVVVPGRARQPLWMN